MERRVLAIGALMGFFGVVAGTFGAHALDRSLSPKMLNVFDVGVRYHMYHALAILGTAWLCRHDACRLAIAAAGCFAAGIVIFSGSLYLLAVTEARWLGMVAPIGGTAFLAGWTLLFITAFKAPPSR